MTKRLYLEPVVDMPAQKGPLAKLFPRIRSRDEILADIRAKPELCEQFFSWEPEAQEDFLACCSGSKGMKVLYDGIFKEVFHPKQTPERLETLLSLLLEREVRIRDVLPNDSVRLGAESSLIYTDIMVELQDGSLADIEIQKIGYDFPGQRCACYSADHLLRQYKRVRGDKQRRFHYRDVKAVYTIVFFEQSTKAFKKFPNQWLHRFRQQSDTGLEMEFLQEYLLIALDIFRESHHNKAIESELDAWLAFLSFDSPERIRELIEYDPMFRGMYQDIYETIRNTYEVMNMYSKELAQMDHNTVLFMINRMQAEIDEQAAKLKEKDAKIAELNQSKQVIDEQAQLICELQARLAKLENG